MTKLSCVVWGAILALAATGCGNLARPNFRCPGTAEDQQARALRFDPYPESEPGPAVGGGRPLDYEKPPAEVLRARWLPWNW